MKEVIFWGEAGYGINPEKASMKKKQSLKTKIFRSLSQDLEKED